MTLKQQCFHCGKFTLAKRLIGLYVGSEEEIKIWECRECFATWTNKFRSVV